MTGKRIRILFNVWADIDNTNAQSLNARDIALRLDPERLESTLFVARHPDPRLVGKEAIHLVRLPPRLRSLVIAYHLIWGSHDILFYPPEGYLMKWYCALIWMGKPKKIIATVEAIAPQGKAVLSSTWQRRIHVLSQADACYAISPYIAETMLREFGVRMGVIPIGVDTTMFTPRDRSVHRPPIKVLYVGTLQPRKQVHLILELAHQIEPGKAEFHIIGYPIGSQTYRDGLLIRKAQGRLDHVHFHGGVAQPEVRLWMQQCDVLLLASRQEGTPKVTLEAAATGMPCVIFDDYRTPTVVDGVTGFQVKTFEEMLDRLQLLIEKRELRLQLGAAAVEHAKQFDWDVVAKRWEEVFEELARG